MAGGKEKPSWTAVISLVIAVSTACFSLYQWWNAETSARINATIEISTKSVLDSSFAQRFKDYSDFVSDNVSAQERIQKNNGAQAYVVYLDYIAKLANTNRLHPDYLSMNLKCQMYNAYDLQYVRKVLRNPEYSRVLPDVRLISDLAEFHRRSANETLPCRAS